MPNRLADETSPYLHQHATGPVDWYPWGDEAWKVAAAENKPVLLSIGYASCHWCHVMEQESFADPEIAALLNRHFVSIKVDREERPDVDAFYVEALQTLTGGAGWPATLFLTPQRKLFFGGTYFPPVARDELPSFRSVIESVSEEWRDSRRDLQRQADGVLRQMRDRDSTLPERQPLTAELLDQSTIRIQSTVDQTHGGFGGAPKFPQPWLVELMLRTAARVPGGAHGISDLTLRRMARGGIYDQLGGGFHRYTADPAWKVPHFEKMLYDNALLARLYTHAWQARRDPLFARIAVETLEYLMRDLRGPEGAFYAAEDSDSGGQEGAYYLWSVEEVARLAPEGLEYYGVTPAGNFEGRNVLTGARDQPPAGARDALGAARLERPRPGRDEQILTSWNGLAIAALAEAGAAFERPYFIEAAKAAAAFLLEHAVTGTGDLLHSHQAVTSNGAVLAEDYAYLADGLYALWEATFEPRWIAESERLARRMLELFWDEDEGGIFSTAGDTGLLLRRKEVIDATTPSVNGVASLLLQRLGVLLGSDELGRRGVEILEAAQPVIQAIPQESGTLLAALDFHLSGAKEIAVVGDRDQPGTVALLREVWTRFLPNRVLAGAPPGIASPLLDDRTAVDAKPTAYVCEHRTCKRPTSDPRELARQLRVAGVPSPDQVNRAADLARFTLHRISLFDRLDNPLWIGPLQEKGFFATPPMPIGHYVPGAMGSPPWPDSKYLARMAGVDPFAVHRVAMGIPETENSLVHEDLTDAALALPADLAADFAVAAKRWLRSSAYHVMLPRKLGTLVSNLAKAGHAGAALDLAETLLELVPDAGQDARAVAGEESFSPPPQPGARFGSWDYEQILTENLPDLVRALQVPTLDLLCDLLVRALELSRAADHHEVGPDGSYLWRPAIDDDERNLDRSLRNCLVSAVRDAAELIARQNPLMLPDIFARLEGRGWPIFRRIGLYLLRVLPEDAPGLAAGELSDRSLLDDPNFCREYLLLARSRFGALPEEQRAEIRRWVEEGPDLARWDAVPDRWASETQDRDAADSYARAWSAGRLELLESDDPDAADQAFAFVPDQPPVDLTTPKQAEWLRSAPLAEIVGFCRTWRPPAEIGAPTPAGLQKKMVEVVTSDPGRYADGAPELAGLPDDYLRAVVVGLGEATRQGTVFAWAPVLGLLTRAVARPVGEGAEADASRRALRISVARCLVAGFGNGDGEIPHEHRGIVWEAVRRITEDVDPAEVDGVPRRSVRAEGLQAVVRYALWVRRHIETQPGGRELARRGWEELPEVRAVLEANLAPAAARSVPVQAVYGQWFPWLLMLDPEWAAAHRGDVFPADASLDHLRQAGWDTYLGMTPVFDQVFQLLSADYQRAVESLVADEGLTRPQQGLAEHLTALYLRGRIPLAGPGSLLAGFFDRASENQRAHALAYVGQMLQSQQERVPTEILLRLQKLWEIRIEAARQASDLSDRAEELAQFGTWFASGKFDEQWAVGQLVDLLTFSGRVGNTNKVVERLKTYMDTMPYEVVQCIAALVARERDAITILGWGQDAQQMLSRIVGGTDPRARDIALDLLDTFDLQPLTELIRWG